MKVNLLFAAVSFLLFVVSVSQCNNCIGSTAAKYDFVNLPGFGWDNLLNENRGKIIKYDYDDCQTTDDGQYLIPDNVFVIPVKSSSVNIFSEIIDHWSNYTSATSKSINVGGSVGIPWIFSIHGSYSAEYQDVKKDQVNDNSMTVRVGARYEKYISKLQSDSSLDDIFRERVLKISNHLLSGRKHTARYESQLLVRDFGTHLVTSVTAGAAIYKLEQLNRTAVQEGSISRSDISKSAGFSFFGSGIDYNQGTTTTVTTVQKYLALRTHSSVKAHGGPLFKPVNFSINEWVDGIGNDIVAVDRSGDPLNFVINIDNFPELPISVIEETASIVEEAIATYYKFNTIKGCTNVNSPNFNYAANVDDGTCQEAGVNLTFGGVFQTCIYNGDLSENLCDALSTVNPKTGADTCPEGYNSVPLFVGNISKTEITQECSSYFIFWKKCQYVPRFGSASYQTNWCAAVKNNVPDNSGFLFGGFFTSVFTNPLANAHGCPPTYKPQQITADLSICLSDDYENGERYSVSFGGLFSCQQGNPLANKYYITGSPPKTCPAGFSEHLATVDEGCEINYCAKMKTSLSGTMPIKSPPFTKQRLERDDNETYIVSTTGRSWTNIYLVPENFSGFSTDVKEWITDDGKDLNVSAMLHANDPPTKNHMRLSETYEGEKSNVVKSKFLKKGRSMTTFEISMIVSVTVLITVMCVIFTTIVILNIQRKKSKKTE